MNQQQYIRALSDEGLAADEIAEAISVPVKEVKAVIVEYMRLVDPSLYKQLFKHSVAVLDAREKALLDELRHYVFVEKRPLRGMTMDPTALKLRYRLHRRFNSIKNACAIAGIDYRKQVNEDKAKKAKKQQ